MENLPDMNIFEGVTKIKEGRELRLRQRKIMDY